jgi:hypothetical protein
MSDLRNDPRGENAEIREYHPNFDEVRQEDMHRERDRQREIQREHGDRGDENPQDKDVGSNESF